MKIETLFEIDEEVFVVETKFMTAYLEPRTIRGFEVRKQDGITITRAIFKNSYAPIFMVYKKEDKAEGEKQRDYMNSPDYKWS